jgi:hypothetical protein
MKRSAALFPNALALGAITHAPWVSAQAQDSREEGPFEIEKCRTIDKPGSYKLVNNLTFSALSGACLQVTANLVTIDLDGFTITEVSPNTGTGSNNATAIAAAQLFGITVRNGSILDFNIGVDLDGDGSIVEGLRVFGGSVSVDFGIIATGVVRGNTIGAIFGFGVMGTGIAATGIVTGNYVTNSKITGIEIGQGSTVIGNTVTNTNRNPGVGLLVSCPSNVTNNTAVDNAGGNLVLDGTGCNNTNNVAP